MGGSRKSGLRKEPEFGRLASRVALVTGGSRGIGEAVVRLFAAEGARVAFCARNEALGKEVEQSVRADGGEATFFGADVSDESDVERLVSAAVDTYGSLDIVVNSAGITATGSIEGFSLQQWRKIFDANVAGTFLVCKHAVPHLRASAHASVINLGSTYGFIGVPGSGAYAATKAAVISLSKTLSLELAVSGVRVNALCPGAVDTPMTDEWLEAQVDQEEAMTKLKRDHPLGRISSAEEQARAALFLASDDSAYVTGHTLMVDGGRTAR